MTRDERMIDTLSEWVNLETPTGDAALINALGLRVADALKQTGARVTRVKLPGGDLLYAELGAGDKRALTIGHMDTVFRAGTGERFDIEGGRLYGAGVADMKAGLVMILEVFRHFQNRLPEGWRLCAIINADEETGSVESAAEIARLAAGARFCLCFEPSPPGQCAIARKGVYSFQIDVVGASGHASSGDRAGNSAIRALVDIAQAAYALSNEDIDVNIGLIEGGERSNIIAGRAMARGEFRGFSIEALNGAREALAGILAQSRGFASAHISREALRPPLIETEGGRALYRIARDCAAREGLKLACKPRGGGSDGALVAARGVPVLDGMGAEGGRMHTRREYAVQATLQARLNTAIATIASLMQTQGA